MPSLILWKERQLKKMRQEFDTLFEKLCQDFLPPTLPLTRHPHFEIMENNDHLVVQVKLTGLEQDKLQVTVCENSVLIKGYRHHEVEQETDGLQGCDFFSTEIKLPCRINPDRVEAAYKNELLKISMVKKKTVSMKQVEIKTE